jgi:hypothetical protein
LRDIESLEKLKASGTAMERMRIMPEVKAKIWEGDARRTVRMPLS